MPTLRHLDLAGFADGNPDLLVGKEVDPVLEHESRGSSCFVPRRSSPVIAVRDVRTV